MIRELTKEDFKNAVRNPYYKDLMTTVTFDIPKEDLETLSELAKINNSSVERLMSGYLSDFAEEIREDV